MSAGDVKTGTGAPTGITFDTNVLIKKVTYSYEPQNVESDDKDGKHYGGRTIKTKVSLTVEGEVLESGASGLAALKNTGSAKISEPRVTNVTINESNTEQHSFTLEAHYFDNTQGNWKFA